MVDVDDKNCLAQLTVALKFNQGAGNGRPDSYRDHCRCAFLSGFYPELVEGFFCTSKRKNIDWLSVTTGFKIFCNEKLKMAFNHFHIVY